ncbi:MAG: preprotein translocase subunit SecE [Peptococcaceae bacterium]|nr:preprotein translocase subunit SecE [Peptococcaceae bacterium]
MAVNRKNKDQTDEKKPAPRGEVALKKSDKKPVPKVDKKPVVKKSTVSRFEQVKQYFRGVYGELKKVHWPTRREIITYTMVVLVAVIIVGILIGVFDTLMSTVLKLFIR